MQEITIANVPWQQFTALLDGVRAEFEVQYNELMDRWHIKLSVDDICVGSFKIINYALLVRGCRPDRFGNLIACLLYTSPSPRDKRQSRMPSSA